jgi:hypothetical protein
LWVIFVLLDPDPDSGSTDPIEYGSNPDPGSGSTTRTYTVPVPYICQATFFSHLNLAENSLVVFVFSFKEFNDASKKNRKLSLKEIFAKMLLRLKVRRAFLK